jgi:hypothetical protein
MQYGSARGQFYRPPWWRCWWTPQCTWCQGPQGLWPIYLPWQCGLQHFQRECSFYWFLLLVPSGFCQILTITTNRLLSLSVKSAQSWLLRTLVILELIWTWRSLLTMLQQSSPTFLAFEGLFDLKRRTCPMISHSIRPEATIMSLCQIGLTQPCNNSHFECVVTTEVK